MPNLVRLEWFRDGDGYECKKFSSIDEMASYVTADAQRLEKYWRSEGDSTFIVPKGGRKLRYRPSDQYPGLFREFADAQPTPAGAIQFANKYGLLGFDDRLFLAPGSFINAEEPMWTAMLQSLPYWRAATDHFREVVELWEAGQAKGNLDPLIDRLNLSSPATPKLWLEKTNDAGRPTMFLQPATLWDGMWLQFYQAITGNVQLRRCAECPTWFPYGSGTGRRKSGHYCSDRCRKTAHRRRKETLS